MPVQPSRSDVHVNRPLTAISLGFMQEEEGFVASKVFPDIPVDKQGDAFFTYPRGEWNRNEMQERGPATESAGTSYTVGTDTYFATVRALHRDVPDQVRSNADDPIDLDEEATRLVSLKALIDREVIFVTSFFTAGDPGDTWTFDVDGDTSTSAAFDPTDAANNSKLRWQDPTSTPIEDIRQGKRFVGEATGFRPNILTLAREVFDVLLDHPDIVGRLDRGQTTGTAIVNRDALAALLELEEVNVMDGVENTALEGATDVHAFISGGRNALLTYRPPRPGVFTPSAGYTFSWNGYLGATGMGTRITTFRMEHLKSDRVEIESAYAQHLVSADLGYFFGDIVL